MANAGDSFTIQLGDSQLEWGAFRNSTNRDIITGEGYIAIPRRYAKMFDIYNSNNLQTGLGYNEFRASSSDGFLQDVLLLAQGCSSAGDVYAKQFSVKGDLKKIGSWYDYMGANGNSSVKVLFTSPTDILLEII